MKLIAALGNYGKLYSNTRHNAGFIIIDYICNAYNVTWHENKKSKSVIAKGNPDGNLVIFAKPSTYMNCSGPSLQAVCSHYKIQPMNMLVIHDDIDLPFGSVKVKYAGGSGGHNGIKSIDNALGNSYYRLRIGIGRPLNTNVDISDYVLSNFHANQYKQVLQIAEQIYHNLCLLYVNNIEEFQRNMRQVFIE